MDKVLIRLAREVIDYYAATDVSQIPHTLSVMQYTQLIAGSEALPARKEVLMTAAAWLHDIGCPEAKRKYGNTKPVSQMKEGKWVAERILNGDYKDLTIEEKSWLTDVVGTHHRFADAKRLGFEPLFEADLIVNFTEGYFSMQNAPLYAERLLTTETGKELFQELFLRNKQHEDL